MEDLKYRRLVELDAIKQISIVDYLALHGYKPRSQNLRIVWYIAPWREEKTPSLAVYLKTPYHDWYDFGERIGGSIIDLAMKIHGLSYAEAVRNLRNLLDYAGKIV